MKITIEVTVEAALANDLRVFLGKVQAGHPLSACAHPRAVGFLGALPRQIETAASYQRALCESSQASVGVS